MVSLETGKIDLAAHQFEANADRKNKYLFDEVLNAMRKVAKEGLTMIVVTHEISFARDIASRVIVEQGPPKEVLYHPKEERTKQFLKRILPDLDYTI